MKTRWVAPPQLLGCLVLLALCLPAMGRLAVMSIDLGGEFMKIAIVKPGVPMEIVLNKESSRKTHSIVAFRDGERHFANEAFNTGVKFPSKAFWFLSHIIGRSYDDPMVQQFKQRFPYYGGSMIKDEERGTVAFKAPDDVVYSVEELMGMLLEKAKEYAQDFAEQKVTDVVITVPPYYNQAERRAVLAAAQMVGLNVLQLMNDNTAVALNYGVFRRKNFNNVTQYYLFYDMGATSTVATIVGYQMVKTKEGTRVETNPQLAIRGVGYDRNLGGLEMTIRLRDHLASIFNSQKKRSLKVEDNPRAMAKLLKEAERVKKVLSANSDHKAQVEGLLEGEDFAARVTREEYMELIKDLLDRVYQPVEDALKSSQITMPEISEIILMGGGSRLPRVQEILLEKSGKTELGKSINTDEAAALGAVYQAAFLGKGFKVKTFHVKDANIFPINVEFEKHKGDESGGDTKTIKRTLFGHMNPFPQRKVMTFNKHFKDFSFAVRYGDLSFLSEEERKAFPSLLLSNVSLVGVEAALQKHPMDDGDYKGVKAHFRMDEAGILHLEKVESVFEKQQIVVDENKKDESTWSKIGSAFGGLFGGEGSEGKEPAEGEANSNKTETASDESDGDKPSSDNSSSDKSDQEEKSEKEKKEEKAEKKKDGENEKEAQEQEDKPQEEEGGEERKDEEDESKKEEEEKKADGEENKSEKEADKKEDKKDEKSEKEEVVKEQEKKPAMPKTVVIKEDIKAIVDVKDLADLSDDKFMEAKKRLSELAKRDAEKAALLKAKNELEGFIFDTQDKLTQELYKTCSTQDERDSIFKALSDASEWMEELPFDATKKVYIDKLKDLRELMKNIILRVYEKEERPKALAALKTHLNSTTVFLETVHNMSDPEDPMFTEVELTTLGKLINETTKWRDDAVAEQAKIPDHENPTLLVETIASKIYALEREMKYLINKAKSFRPKVKTSDNKTEKTQEKKKKKTTTKKEEEEENAAAKEGDEDEDADGQVEDEEEGEEGTTSGTPPEEQEPAPETENKEEEEAVEKADAKPKKPKASEQAGKKKRPKKNRVEEETKTGEEDILELGSDDLPSGEDTHEEL